MSLTSLALANILVIWDCKDSTLQDCQVYQREIVAPASCADAAEHVLEVARKLEYSGSIITYCTDKPGLNDLPIPARVPSADKTKLEI